MLKFSLWGSTGAALDPQPAPIASGHSDKADRFVTGFEESQAGWFWSTDEFGRLTYVSESLEKWLDQPNGALLGCKLVDLFARADEDITGRRSLSFLLTKQSSFEKLTIKPHGSSPTLYWSLSGRARFDPSGAFAGYDGCAIDVTEHRRSSETASKLARYDILTGLPNQHPMTELLNASLLAAQQRKIPCAVMRINLDRFKQVNDTLGHTAGDKLLKEVADRLILIVGDREKVFRSGGDEFQIIFPNCGDRGIIGGKAKEIIASLSRPYSVEGSRCIIGASIGIAIAPVDGVTKDELTRSIDLALDAAKSGGRGRFRFFCTELLQLAEDRRALEKDLQNALPRGEFSVVYQPIVCAKTNVMTGAEALIRWQHPTRGSIPPSLFIPLAEETGLIGVIGKWLLRQACQDAAKWPGNLRVAVNVSPIQFTNDAFPATVKAALEDSGLPPDQLELEITEGVFLGEAPETDITFTTLKEIGVRLALDDFGTGYSSLGYLRTAPFDKIKIDQSFVHAATLPESRNGAIIAAIVALADALGMETTAEGIEYMDQLQLIRDLRVSHVQGWIYSKAISSAELVGRITAGDWLIEPVGPARQRSPRRTIFRKVGIIHGSRYDQAIVRNLSDSGALVEGVPDMPAGTLVVVDFGDGQLTFARVKRSNGRQIGIAFEQPLVDDGDGGLCTSQRVSPHLLRSVGVPSSENGEESAEIGISNVVPMEVLAEKLGLTLAPPSKGDDPESDASTTSDGGSKVPTLRELADSYIQSVPGDQRDREQTWRDLRNHVLPRFGEIRVDQLSKQDISTWIATKVEAEKQPPGTDVRLHSLMNQMWALAAKLKLPGAEPNSLPGQGRVARRSNSADGLTVAEVHKLLAAARTSHNRQLKFILPLLMLTGARAAELLKAKWEQFDLVSGLWTLPTREAGTPRSLQLSGAAIALINNLPRWENCPYLLPNPATRRPYRSIHRSWDVVRTCAGLSHLELHDLRFCDIGTAIPEDRILAMVTQDGAYTADDEGGELGSTNTAASSLAA